MTTRMEMTTATTERNPNVYNTVMSSPLLNPSMQQVYWALWQYPQGLTKGEITNYLASQGCPPNSAEPWHKQIGVLVKMGLLVRGNKRHCTASNKEDTLWQLTTLTTPAKPKANKPSAGRYKKAVAQFEAVILHHEQKGDGLVTPELKMLYEWVRDKV